MEHPHDGNDQLYAAKYLTYMPTQEELRREIEQQKEFYKLQNKQWTMNNEQCTIDNEQWI